jgi:GNAT superfamily N-acetyltransferase
VSELRFEQVRPEMVGALEALELATFPTIDPDDLYARKDLALLAERFPEGGIAVFDGDELVGMGLGILLDFDFEHPDHDLGSVYSNHDPDGEWYYGTTIAVNPAYRGRGIGRRLYELRKDVARRHNCRGIVAGGVIPGYADHIDQMSASDYIDRVRAGELYDPTLTFQIENGFEAVQVLENYLQDSSVGNNAVLIVWHNPDFSESERSSGAAATETSESNHAPPLQERP